MSKEHQKKFVVIFVLIVTSYSFCFSEMSKIKFRVLTGLTQSEEFINNQSLGFWGFVGYGLDKKEYLNGYFFGISLATPPIKKLFEVFMDANIYNSSLILGKKGEILKGMAIRYADPNQYSSESPVLPNDIYYISKAISTRLGLKIIPYSTNWISTYFGIALGVVSYEMGFGNKDASVAFSEIVYDITTTTSFVFGSNFKLAYNFELGIFFEVGGATSGPKEIRNWIWQGWNYRLANFPVIPTFKIGLSLGV